MPRVRTPSSHTFQKSQQTDNIDLDTSIYQSNGLCYTFCNGYAFAIVQDNGCWCSNYVPGTTTTGCDETCPGFPPELCGSLSNGLYGYVALPNTPSGTQGGGGASPTGKSVSQSMISLHSQYCYTAIPLALRSNCFDLTTNR